ENRTLRHYPDVCFHGASITFTSGGFTRGGFRRVGEKRVRNPFRRYGPARLLAGPCAGRWRTPREEWCETSPGHRWKVRQGFRGEEVWAAGDLRFLRSYGGAAWRGRRFLCCFLDKSLAGSSSPRANPLMGDRE